MTLVMTGQLVRLVHVHLHTNALQLDRVGNGLRHGRHPNAQEADRLGRVLRGIATALGA